MNMDNKIKIDLENIDVEEIVAQIHKNVAARGYSQEDLSTLNHQFSIMNMELIESDPSACIELMDAKADVQYWWPMNSRPGILGPLKTITQKTVRKLVYFFMKHVMDQQIEFNRSSVRTLASLNEYIMTLEKKNEDQIQFMKDSIKQLKIENAQLDKKLDQFRIELSQQSETDRSTSIGIIGVHNIKEDY